MRKRYTDTQAIDEYRRKGTREVGSLEKEASGFCPPNIVSTVCLAADVCVSEVCPVRVINQCRSVEAGVRTGQTVFACVSAWRRARACVGDGGEPHKKVRTRNDDRVCRCSDTLLDEANLVLLTGKGLGTLVPERNS